MVVEKGYVLNTEARVGEAVIKGRLIGKLAAEDPKFTRVRTSKGRLQLRQLVIPAGHHFRWTEPIRVGGADIGGELTARLCASGTVRLKSTSHFFGDVEAGNLVVEAGAVFVGSARIGTDRLNGPALRSNLTD